MDESDVYNVLVEAGLKYPDGTTLSFRQYLAKIICQRFGKRQELMPLTYESIRNNIFDSGEVVAVPKNPNELKEFIDNLCKRVVERFGTSPVKVPEKWDINLYNRNGEMRAECFGRNNTINEFYRLNPQIKEGE